MRRTLPLLLLLVASLSACSYSSQFVVINESDAPAEVYYALKEPREGPKNYCGRPAKKTVEQLEASDTQWRELGGNEYSCDDRARAVTVKLYPKEALLVERVRDYFNHDDGSDESFGIESIRLTGAHGSIQYSGRAARTHFVEGEQRVFAITYR